jgi:hypothetical protein
MGNAFASSIGKDGRPNRFLMKPLQYVTFFFNGTLVLFTGVVLWNGLSCNSYAQSPRNPPSKPTARSH